MSRGWGSKKLKPLPRNVPKRYKCTSCNFVAIEGRDEEKMWQHFFKTGSYKAGHMAWIRFRGHRVVG